MKRGEVDVEMGGYHFITLQFNCIYSVSVGGE